MPRALLAELQRRRVFRALVGYGIGAFAVLQIIEPVMHGLHWPDAVLGYVVVALALGFPVVVTLAWVFDVKAGSDIGLSKPRVALVLAAIGVLSGAPGVAWYFVLRPRSAPASKVIAVLPFASLSAERDTAYFADGFHDELLRQMARLGDLEVISRTSVLQYREGARNLREIGEALGVSTIVEGSVQRAGNRVRVEARLVDARTDRQLWSERYDRDLTDVFAIQSAVAEEIAGALRARLSPEQKQQLQKKPTENALAWNLYLRAREYDVQPTEIPKESAAMEALYHEAIKADPSFALSRAQLAIALLNRSWIIPGSPRTLVEDAKREADEALRLEPDLPQAHLALGFFHYWGNRQYEPALREFELARTGAQDEALPAIAFIQRRQGRFEEAIVNLEQGLRLNPRSASLAGELAATYEQVRRYPEAEKVYRRAAQISPDADLPRFKFAFLYEKWRGDREPARALLRDLAARADPRDRLESWAVPLMLHNPEEALLVLDRVRAETFVGIAIHPRDLMLAFAHDALGDTAQARKEYEAALPRLESEVRLHDEHGEQHGLLGWAYAALGRKEDALREARRGVEILPMSKDALYGSWVLISLALVEGRVGEIDAAIGHIRELLGRPSHLSAGLLRVDPRWAPLHNDDRFRELAEIKIPVRASQ